MSKQSHNKKEIIKTKEKKEDELNETNNFNVFIIGNNQKGQIGSLNDDDNLVDSCSNDHQTWRVYGNIQYSYCGWQYIIHKSKKGGIYGVGENGAGCLGLGHTKKVSTLLSKLKQTFL